MIAKKAFEKACGGAFTTRKRVADALGYKDPHSVDKYLRGLTKYGGRYFTEEVYDRIVGEA